MPYVQIFVYYEIIVLIDQAGVLELCLLLNSSMYAFGQEQLVLNKITGLGPNLSSL